MDIRPEDKKKVESVLFTTGKLMSLQDIGTPIELTDPDYIKAVLESLKIDYSSRESALHIQQVDDKYRLNIRKDYGYVANKLLGTTELEGPAIKTLAVIAYKEPALQADIIKIRGNKAYDHIAVLKEQNLIEIKGKKGRTNVLALTPHFYDYFDTAAKEVKEKFETIKQEMQQQPAQPTPETTPTSTETVAAEVRTTEDESMLTEETETITNEPPAAEQQEATNNEEETDDIEED
ncbi:MAG: SMC-Scp complex subunit ScpB [Nanoarchaeota archaeon]|nr:SMC-Scp complex subunit ScpB [Nanoarchaeota archaeon]